LFLFFRRYSSAIGVSDSKPRNATSGFESKLPLRGVWRSPFGVRRSIWLCFFKIRATGKVCLSPFAAERRAPSAYSFRSVTEQAFSQITGNCCVPCISLSLLISPFRAAWILCQPVRKLTNSRFKVLFRQAARILSGS
jgi:hypothetical protein